MKTRQTFTFVQHLESLYDIATESFYIVDLRQKQFCYIKPDDLFLCGSSEEEALATSESGDRQIMTCYISVKYEKGKPIETLTYCGDFQPIRCIYWSTAEQCSR
jgi:hypothetical protein